MNREEAEALKVFRSPFDIKTGENFHLRFGPLDLYVERSSTEFRVRWMTSNDWMDSSFHFQNPFTGMLPLNLLAEKRFAFSHKAPTLKITPILGEKAFVVKPDTTFMILPGEKAKIYLSTPMNVALHDLNNQKLIDEFPVLHRIQTWFGETPTRGQLCFVTKIHAALIEENLPFRPHRALTHLFVENGSDVAIPIEKLKIPVNHFTLYQDSRGLFVTSSLSIRIDHKRRIRGLKIFSPQEEVGEVVVMEEPRDLIPKTLFKSASEIMR